MIFSKLSHWMRHTQEPYARVYEQLIFWFEVLTQCYLVYCILTFSPSNLTATFSSVSSNDNIWKDFLAGLLKLSLALGMICVNKNVHLVLQHPSLVSVAEGPTDTSEILITMPKLWQKLFIYNCFSPKWEGFIVINSLIFVAVSKNILNCLNFVKNYGQN